MAWPWALTILILAPLLAPGYVLSYDMVFVPDLAMRSDFLGLGSGLPRAVPSDAVVAVLDEVVPGMILQKVALVAALGLAGTGARRLVPAESGVAQLAATSLYVWNPYVAERLGMGHWPVLLAYAALPWVVDAARRLRGGEPTGAALVLWLALAALSASGGVMAAVVALAFTLGTSRAALRRSLFVAAAAAVVNLPWIVAGALHGSGAVTDPAGVEAFAATGEGPLPMPLAALGLGGIWNLEVVPLSRQGWAAVAALVLMIAVSAVGARAWWSATPRGDVAAFASCAAVGLGIAGLGVVAPELTARFLSTVPGAGIVRDGARFLGLLAPLEASLFGFGAGVLATLGRERLTKVSLAAGAVLMPVALMPDLALGLAGALRPVDFPEEYAEARVALEDAVGGSETGSVLILPFTSYRVPPWNNDRRTLDPLGRYLTPNYLANDDLFVSGGRIAGEDERARRVARILAGQGAEDPRAALRAAGISWVAVDLQAEAAVGEEKLTVQRTGPSVFDGRQLQVWSLAGEAGARHLARTDVLLVAAAWAGSAALVLVCIVTTTRRRWRHGPKAPGRRSSR